MDVLRFFFDNDEHLGGLILVLVVIGWAIAECRESK